MIEFWDWSTIWRKISLQMSSGWRRAFGNARSFIGNSMGGLRGGSSLASWAVAGTLAYFLWVRPSQQLKREQEVETRSYSCLIRFLSPIFREIVINLFGICRNELRWLRRRILIDMLRRGNQFRILRLVLYWIFSILWRSFWFWVNWKNVQILEFMNLQETGLVYGNKNGAKRSEWSFFEDRGG